MFFFFTEPREGPKDGDSFEQEKGILISSLGLFLGLVWMVERLFHPDQAQDVSSSKILLLLSFTAANILNSTSPFSEIRKEEICNLRVTPIRIVAISDLKRKSFWSESPSHPISFPHKNKQRVKALLGTWVIVKDFDFYTLRIFLQQNMSRRGTMLLQDEANKPKISLSVSKSNLSIRLEHGAISSELQLQMAIAVSQGNVYQLSGSILTGNYTPFAQIITPLSQCRAL